MPLPDLLRLAVAVLALVVLACGALAWTGRRTIPDALVAVLRALFALAIGWIFAHPVGVVLPSLLVSIGMGAAIILGVVLAAGALAPTGQEILPFTAQVIGGAMTAASLAGL